MKDGMVVAFHLEDAGIAIADIDHPGILARALDHPGRLGGQLFQMGAGGFVGAMLAPHHAEDAQLDKGGLAAHQLQDAVIFGVRKPMLADDLRRDLGHGLMTALRSGSGTACGRRCRPAAGSTTRSGWGIRPSTLRFSLRMPAMLRAEPLGLSPWHSGRRRGLRLPAGPAFPRRRNSCLRHAPPGKVTRWPLLIFAGEGRTGFPPRPAPPACRRI